MRQRNREVACLSCVEPEPNKGQAGLASGNGKRSGAPKLYILDEYESSIFPVRECPAQKKDRPNCCDKYDPRAGSYETATQQLEINQTIDYITSLVDHGTDLNLPNGG
jgi:hypothetical protein